MKIFSLLSLFAVAAIAFFIFAKSPADTKPETIMVKSLHYTTGSESFVWVDYGNGKWESTPLAMENDRYNNIQANSSKVLGIIQKLNGDGYKVISHSESGYKLDDGGNYHGDTWVLVLK